MSAAGISVSLSVSLLSLCLFYLPPPPQRSDEYRVRLVL